MRFLLALIIVSFHLSADDSSIFLTVIARNKAHLLPKYLQCLDQLDYDKKKITLYIHTYNNEDDTKEILSSWSKKNEGKYLSILFENHEYPNIPSNKLHKISPLTAEEVQLISEVKTRSMQKCIESKSDFYFLVDCNTFIASCTLKELTQRNKPIIAPLLRAIPEHNDIFSNYFCAITENGYYADHPDFLKILFHWKVGTFQVPLVHSTYLIKSEYLDKLHYLNDTYEYDSVVFARKARVMEIEQYICNESEFGVLVHHNQSLSPDDERLKLRTLLMLP